LARAQHRRGAGFSWALLQPIAHRNACMTFMKVNEVLQHRGGGGVDQGNLFGNPHSSRTKDDSADPAIDPSIGMPVMGSVPDRDYSCTLWHGYHWY
jgi:hypothetical protein